MNSSFLFYTRGSVARCESSWWLSTCTQCTCPASTSFLATCKHFRTLCMPLQPPAVPMTEAAVSSFCIRACEVTSCALASPADTTVSCSCVCVWMRLRVRERGAGEGGRYTRRRVRGWVEIRVCFANVCCATVPTYITSTTIQSRACAHAHACTH